MGFMRGMRRRKCSTGTGEAGEKMQSYHNIFKASMKLEEEE